MKDIEHALRALGANHEPPLGWEARVLEATATCRPAPWWGRLAAWLLSGGEAMVWRIRDLVSSIKEFVVDKHPKRLSPADVEIRITNAQLSAPATTVSLSLSMTSDRPCMTDSGLLIQPGTKVTYMGHLPGQAVKVRMEDGSEEVVHPHCFPELR